VTKAKPNHIAQCRCGAVEVGLERPHPGRRLLLRRLPGRVRTPCRIRQFGAFGRRRRRHRIYRVPPGPHRLHARRGKPSANEADRCDQDPANDSGLLHHANVRGVRRQAALGVGVPRQFRPRRAAGANADLHPVQTASQRRLARPPRLSGGDDSPRSRRLAAYAGQPAGWRFALIRALFATARMLIRLYLARKATPSQSKGVENAPCMRCSAKPSSDAGLLSHRCIGSPAWLGQNSISLTGFDELRSLMGQGARGSSGCRRFRAPAFSACSFGT
jgi:hypothetical protein